MNPEETAAKYDAYKKRRAAGEEVVLTPAEAVEFISELPILKTNSIEIKVFRANSMQIRVCYNASRHAKGGRI